MRLYVNRDTSALITKFSTPEALTSAAGTNSMARKRGDSATLEFLFGRPYGAAEDLEAEGTLTSFRFGVKLDGDFAGDYVVSNWDGDEFAFTKAILTVADAATTNADATLTSATATFTSADVGLTIAGAGIPAGATILSVTSSTSIELSANATATATGVTITLGRTPAYSVAPSFNTEELGDALVDGTIKDEVADEAARFALSGWLVGEIAAQRDLGTYWIVIDDAELDNDAGWELAPQLEFIDLDAEVEAIVDGKVESTLTWILRVYNDVNKGTEGVPTEATPGYPLADEIALKAAVPSFLTVPWIGDAIAEAIFGRWEFQATTEIEKAWITAQDAPTGSALVIDLIGDSDVLATMTLPAGQASADITFDPVLTPSGNLPFWLKFTAVGNPTPGQNIVVFLQLKIP